RITRHVAAAPSDSTNGRPPRSGQFRDLEARPHHRDGSPGKGAARSSLVPQRPVSLPLLRSPSRHGAHSEVARPSTPDRPAPVEPSRLDVAVVAGQGLGPIAVL